MVYVSASLFIIYLFFSICCFLHWNELTLLEIFGLPVFLMSLCFLNKKFYIFLAIFWTKRLMNWIFSSLCCWHLSWGHKNSTFDFRKFSQILRSLDCSWIPYAANALIIHFYLTSFLDQSLFSVYLVS